MDYSFSERKAHLIILNLDQGTNMDGDPELLDDSEFYQQLLKEFFEAVDPASSGKMFNTPTPSSK